MTVHQSTYGLTTSPKLIVNIRNSEKELTGIVASINQIGQYKQVKGPRLYFKDNRTQ